MDNILVASLEVLQESQQISNTSSRSKHCHKIVSLIFAINNRILESLDNVVDGILVDDVSVPVVFALRSFAVSVKQVVPEEFSKSGHNFSVNLSSFSKQNISSDELSFGENFESHPTGSIQLPNNLLSELPENISDPRITHTVFMTDSIFLRRNFNFRNVSSIVMSANVAGMTTIQNLSSPVNLGFQRNPVR